MEHLKDIELPKMTPINYDVLDTEVPEVDNYEQLPEESQLETTDTFEASTVVKKTKEIPIDVDFESSTASSSASSFNFTRIYT